MKITKYCIICEKPVTRYASGFIGDICCCSRKCSSVYLANKMANMNKELNPDRMIPETKEKLRNSRLGKGEGKTYTKTYGKHTHRIVAEQILGRPLVKGEIVHHKDHNKRNNDPSNLHVFPSQAEHVRFHNLEKAEKKRNAL